MKSILDPTFVYVRSDHTDIRKTFERVRAQQAYNAKVDALMEQHPFVASLRIPADFWYGLGGIGKTITISDVTGGVVGDDSGA